MIEFMLITSVASLLNIYGVIAITDTDIDIQPPKTGIVIVEDVATRQR